ncbi:hypothetical protein [Streptomyces alanosinicus]|uniref:Uncharacterized protein n=1 Tax=Streptomyces alanosinicus TaxID=68171 RepID=A0A919D9N4_9ACTN|nr:hypothetical protein [Streptomyces alanosinicus]GHE16082.1 hypothetical protein GCM10010339_92830 [Streptomyces alanosinicus]
MGKRAQQKRAAKHAKQAKQRKAAASRSAATFATVAASLPQPTSMDDILFWITATPRGGFADSYATVDDAIVAAEKAGGVLSCFSFDESGEYEQTLRQDADGWRYEVALYPRLGLRELVKTSWLDADDRDQAVQQLRRAMAAYVPESLRHPGLEAVQRPSTTSVPRIGWAQSVPVAGMRAWEDVRLVEQEMGLFDLVPLADGPDGGLCWGLAEEAFALFRAHGLSARACARCSAPVTDRHPHWPGVLVSVENEFGPVCGHFRPGGESPQRVGHVLDAAQDRPVGKLTGKEQKVRCQHCDVHVTEQHPDWPGVWTESGGSGSPNCAVLGAGADDATEYDLVDCVYPHVPVGADSPAAAAITAAKKVGYFLQPRLRSWAQ